MGEIRISEVKTFSGPTGLNATARLAGPGIVVRKNGGLKGRDPDVRRKLVRPSLEGMARRAVRLLSTDASARRPDPEQVARERRARAQEFRRISLSSPPMASAGFPKAWQFSSAFTDSG